MMTRPNWLRQAITGDDNATIDPSFLIVIFMVFVLLPSAIGVMSWLSFTDVYVNKREFAPAAFGGGVAALLAGVSAFIAAAAVILKADRQQPTTPPAVV